MSYASKTLLQPLEMGLVKVISGHREYPCYLGDLMAVMEGDWQGLSRV